MPSVHKYVLHKLGCVIGAAQLRVYCLIVLNRYSLRLPVKLFARRSYPKSTMPLDKQVGAGGLIVHGDQRIEPVLQIQMMGHVPDRIL